MTQGRMIHIGIDVRMAQNTGIGRYIRGTVSALDSSNSHWKYTFIGDERFRNDFPLKSHFVAANVPIYSISEQIAMPQMARSVDCLHVPHYNAPLFWKRKLVVTIHDLIHLHFPDHLPSLFARWYAQTMLPQVTKRADAIIAVSEYTKNDLIKTLRIQPEKITVIHHGIDRQFISENRRTDNSVEKIEPYFLYVGLIKAHKNIGVLLEAFRNLKRKLNLPELRLHLVGTTDRKQSIVQKWLAEIGQNSDIIHSTNLSDYELKRLYRNAIALVFPSLYEGFGFPLLEAMASRIPIIASRAASIPEVLGESAGLYFDPHSTSELQNCMERVLKSADIRNQLVREGSKRVALFDWKSSGKKTEQVYESVLGSN